MGTRADFYTVVNSTEQPYTTFNWLGSVGWSGYPQAFLGMLDVKSEQDFKQYIAAELSTRDDFTTPSRGWPWPWKGSNATDYAYAFDIDSNEVVVARFGKGWTSFAQAVEAEKRGDEGLLYDQFDGEGLGFPDLSEGGELALDKRSGLIFFQSGMPPVQGP